MRQAHLRMRRDACGYWNLHPSILPSAIPATLLSKLKGITLILFAHPSCHQRCTLEYYSESALASGSFASPFYLVRGQP